MLHDEFEKIDLKEFVCRYAPGLCKRWDQKETETKPTFTKYQTDIQKTLSDIYSPYVGQGTIGGLSDLEQNALNMLKSADVWSPLTTAGKGLLTGTLGPKTITPEESNALYQGSVVTPAEYNWSRYGGTRDTLANELAGPSYLSRGKNIIADKYAEMENALAAGKGGWEANIANINRAIEESKAGRALSALTSYPSSLLGWAGGISSLGQQANQILNQISDPQVLAALQTILGVQPTGQITTTPFNALDYMKLLQGGAKTLAALP